MPGCCHLQVSHDLRAPQAGYVEEILVEDGDTVEIGQNLLNMKEGEAPAGAACMYAAHLSCPSRVMCFVCSSVHWYWCGG